MDRDLFALDLAARLGATKEGDAMLYVPPVGMTAASTMDALVENGTLVAWHRFDAGTLVLRRGPKSLAGELRPKALGQGTMMVPLDPEVVLRQKFLELLARTLAECEAGQGFEIRVLGARSVGDVLGATVERGWVERYDLDNLRRMLRVVRGEEKLDYAAALGVLLQMS